MAKLAKQAIDCDGIDTDATMAANSDNRIPSQKAVKTALGGAIAASAIDTDGTLSSNSDVKVPSVKAVRTAILGGTIAPALLATITYLNQLDDWRAVGVPDRPVTFLRFS